ncbi:TfoX/Sxy family protein [Cryptosporangium phraense]|uniref:TfoX/Sxy family protein n=1 Tax=Cryptosporangium phraense TaxID=2593070 RepID=A0A545AWY9_9ACTN|nr:TfoX/Sxy family protein [Cryptosporangium phraense]TQS45849.1 TfoX/Sxy family protein [Cryptosporangium phraense]
MSPDEYFAEIVDDLAPEGVRPGKMFGRQALKFEDKVLAVYHRDDMVFKLGAGTPPHSEALALAGAELFDPSGKGRPFKDWVLVPVDHAERWASYAGASLSHLRG